MGVVSSLLASLTLVPSAPHLHEINAVAGDLSWVARYGEAPSPAADPDERARVHLAWVVEVLSERLPPELEPIPRARRALLLAELALYAAAGELPVNTDDPFHRPEFIDGAGRRCAVGHLMAASGAPELAELTNARYAFERVHGMDAPEIAAWAAAHGFTADELALIQPAYGFQPPEYNHPRYHSNILMGGRAGATVYADSDYSSSWEGLSGSPDPTLVANFYTLWQPVFGLGVGGSLWVHSDLDDYYEGNSPALDANLMLEYAHPVGEWHDVLIFAEAGGTFLVGSPGEFMGVNYGGGVGGIYHFAHTTFGIRLDVKAQGYTLWDTAGTDEEISGFALLATLGMRWTWEM